MAEEMKMTGTIDQEYPQTPSDTPANDTFQQSGSIVPEFYDEMGVIGPETKVVGNIVTKGHVTVLGSVKGDITANGNVILKGDVKGKIVCDSILIEDCNITADIEAKSQISVKSGVTVSGEINCSSISVMGTVLGNINAKDKVGLSDTAVIKGNITAAQLGTALGAQIEGNLSIRRK